MTAMVPGAGRLRRKHVLAFQAEILPQSSVQSRVHTGLLAFQRPMSDLVGGRL